MERQTLVSILIAGRWFMIPLMMCSIVMIAVILERRRSLENVTIDLEPFRRRMTDLLLQGQVGEARALAEGTPGPVAEILGVGLRRYQMLRGIGRPLDAIEDGVVKAMEDHAPHVIAGLERYLVVLATVGNIAPLFGFAGTVTGMINTFRMIAIKGSDVEFISIGISEALITTATGLLIAIPAFIAYNYFTTRVQKFVLEIEENSTRLLELMATATADAAPGREQA